MDGDGAGYGKKPVARPAVLASHHMMGAKRKPEAAVIPRPSLPSPRFRVRSVKGRILVFLGLRAVEAASISGYPPGGLRTEAPLVGRQGLLGRAPLLGLTIPPQEVGSSV